MLIHNFRPGPVGGAELQAERLASRLVAMGHEMQVLTMRTVPDALSEETLDGVRIHRVDYHLAYWVDHGAGQTFRDLVKMRSTYDILHAHMAFGHAVVAVVVARCFGKKSIIKIACAGEFGDLAKFSRFRGFGKALRVLRQADAVVAVSSEVEQELLSYNFPHQRIVRIPNGVDTAYFRPRSSRERGRKTRFILIGRRHPQKGVDVALSAAKILRDRGLASRFQINFYGADYPEYDYRIMANAVGVASFVHFAPHQQDMLSVYQDADCFLLPSRGEGLSNALLEAMAMELPVVATAVSGTIDVVDDSVDGLLIPPDSPEALADAMQMIMENPRLASELGKMARKKVERHYSLESVARQYSDLYEQL
ncbi:glycosyltransferase family 1 protein [Candidatus Parcubacteria bacterium]|nr:MAG: glycosyltransferase family 1 protein [Candidatus Parcubacteria bacterium]